MEPEPSAGGPLPVSQVDIYWDTSASMPKTFLRKPGVSNALGLLWKNLSRSWVRVADSEITQVNQYGMGREIVPLVQIGAWPKLTSDYTNIPEAASRAGKLLAATPGAAVVVVSDMQVDRPPQSPGEDVCGQIKAAAGPGRVPAYFGQCLAESWTTVPVWTTLSGVVVRASEPDLRAPLPLFVMVLARNPSYARALADRLVERLSEESKGVLEAERLVLVAHQPSLRCDEVSKCSYWVRPDILALHKDEKGAELCRFRPTATIGTHALRCSTKAADPGEEGFIRLGRGRPESLDRSRLLLEQPKSGYVDLKWNLGDWGPGAASASLHFSYDWVIVADLNDRIDAWLGDTGAQGDDYRSTFATAVMAIHAKLPPPICKERWSVRYVR